MSETQERDVVHERCPKCDTLLDVADCTPLTEATCPGCGSLIKVLKAFHHFVLLSQLGQGGSGTVFRAFDETLERDVALKLLRNAHTREAQYLEGREREATITASINHPHIVKVFSTGAKNGYYYIAMEIVTGGSLAERLQRQGRLSEASTIAVAVQITEGLQAAYERSLLHRDVKPGNILFVDAHTAKVADFGLAMPLEEAAESTEAIWGTPGYIAPEKLLKQGEDVRSDIYSLGSTLFHCLTGVPPMDKTKVWMVIKSRKPRPAPGVEDFAPETSAATAALIRRCLEVRPGDRYQSYQDLLNDLLRIQEHLGGKASAFPLPQRKKPAGKPWRLVTLSIALLVFMIALSGILALHQKGARPRNQVTQQQSKNAAPATSEHATPGPQTAQVGMLSASVGVAATTTYNLTALGTLDWAHWNGNFIHKVTGGNRISDVTRVGGGGRYGVFANSARNVSWTDGSPVSENACDMNFMWCKEKDGAGWSFTVVADRMPHSLTVLYGGASNPLRSLVTINAHLSDNSAPDFTHTQETTLRNLLSATFVFRASRSGEKLVITLTTSRNKDVVESVDLDAAWLQ